MPSLRAAYSWVSLVFTGVSGKLGDSATGAHEGTAEVLVAAGAILLWNVILFTDSLTRPPQAIDQPDCKQKRADCFDQRQATWFFPKSIG